MVHPDAKDLEFLTERGNRNYWDQMSLENRGGNTPLLINHLKLQLDYDIGDSSIDNFLEEIIIIDSTVNPIQLLNSGKSAIDLEPYARSSRSKLISSDGAHPSAILAGLDLGKYGSDKKDQYTGNPKYVNSNDEKLCSEFVSWYYHEAGVVINEPDEFKDIISTEKLSSIFYKDDRLYRYHNGKEKFIHPDDSSKIYSPRSGDFLERRIADNGEPEHAMIVDSWDDLNKSITVIDGPWPVTKRTIKLTDVEKDKNKDFWVGRISPID